MILQIGHFTFHAPPAKDLHQFQFKQSLRKRPDHEKDQRHAGDDQKDVEDAAGVRKRMHLLVANGAQGDDHHVKAVKPSPALDEMKPHSARAGEQQQRQSKDLEQAKTTEVQESVLFFL